MQCIDLKKEFNTVNDSRLLKKPENYGVRRIPLQWFQSYVPGRKQDVSVARNLSEAGNFMWSLIGFCAWIIFSPVHK